jgi:hypothetical protein
VGEWNHYAITVKGNAITITPNGKTVIPEATNPSIPDRGRIAFQDHGNKNDGVWIGHPDSFNSRTSTSRAVSGCGFSPTCAKTSSMSSLGGSDTPSDLKVSTT